MLEVCLNFFHVHRDFNPAEQDTDVYFDYLAMWWKSAFHILRGVNGLLSLKKSAHKLMGM
jgi:hypothetical protein